jgi:NADH dehydrogenase
VVGDAATVGMGGADNANFHGASIRTNYPITNLPITINFMILVTGSTGFVGRSLMRALGLAGQEVRGYQGRINDPHSLREQMEGVETVIHLATAEVYGSARRLQHVDVDGTARLLEEARRVNVNHIIYISRIGADPNSMYALFRVKGEAERLVATSGIPYTILRSATLFGRDDRFLTTIATLAVWNWPFVWLPSAGRPLLQPLWVEDLVRCVITVADPLDLKGYRGKVHTIAGQERLHYAEVVHLVTSAAALKRRPLNIRMPLVRGITALFFSWRRRPPITRFFLDRLAVPEVADLEITQRTFGFRPERMAQHLTYLRQTGLAWRIFR